MENKGRALRKRRALAVGAVGALIVGHVLGATAAFGAESDNSEAEGRLITGNTSALDLNSVVELAGAYSADPSAPGEVNHPLSAEILNALDIDLGDGLQLFGENGIVGVGALGQFASTAEGAAPLASAGLVNADGSIAVGTGDPSENAYVDLGPILAGAGLDALLDDARLELGAISALATTEAGEPTGDYQIANGTLLLTSPTLAGLSGQLVGTLGQVSDPINALAGADGVIADTVDPLLDPLVETLNTLLLGIGSVDDLGVTATVDLDLESAVQSALAEPLTSDDSVLTIDLSTGTVSVDLARLVADTQGGDYDGTLNGLPVNTELLDPDLVQATLDGAIGSTLDQIPALLVNVVTDALHAADVNVAITGEIGSLLGSIGDVDIQLSGTLGDFVGAEGSQAPVVDTDGTSVVGLPVGTLLEPILQTVTGTILPALVTPLSGAITDEGTLDTIFRPIVETANTALQPLFGLVTNNLLSLTANVQENPGDFTDAAGFDEGSFTQRALQLTLLPAASTPLLQLSLASATVRAEAVAEVAITSPSDGTTITVDTADATTPLEVTGTGEPGASITVSIPGVGDQTTTVDVDGNWTVTFPAVPVGEHTITATQDGGSTDTVGVIVEVDAAADADADVTDADATDADATDATDATDADATDADATDATDADATDADATDADATDADATDATDADATDADATDATDADATDADATDADATDADATDATDADATDADATDADATDADATDATDADATDADATDADATDADATDATDADATDADATDADATDADATDATDADATDADATDADATDADATDADATDATDADATDATDADATDADATDADATDADATDADATDADATDADATDATDADATDADATDVNADATDADATDADAADADATDADATDDGTAVEIEVTAQVPVLEVGDTQTAVGTGFQPGETVTGTMNSDPLALGTQVADSNGTVTFTWKIPAGTDLGTHSVTLSGAESGSDSDTFRVVADGLATTGLDTGLAVPIGIVLAALGAAGIVIGRRKLTA
ncbi:choice-of-anchor G family protein [Microbacterium sp. CIAB417]|uniref:choice-of-anchor G family protein n=1 Tax=Microbacterium sp. CIAB417 TaxID=2860287 RepID=UPI001FADF005|nr:choice-of-anchor G family protein [Microbacterium sp. CIAB417]